MDERLQSAIIAQLKGWTYIRDIFWQGPDAGFPGFTYPQDTKKFFLENQAIIAEHIIKVAESLHARPSDFVRSLVWLDGDNKAIQAEIGRALYGNVLQTDILVTNALCWFVLSELARGCFGDKK